MRIFFLTPFLILVGCFAGNQYDNNELRYLSEVRVLSETLVCNNQEKAKEQSRELYFSSREFELYSEFSSGTETLELAIELTGLTKEFYQRTLSEEGFSLVYCKLKMKNINQAATVIARTVGQKIR